MHQWVDFYDSSHSIYVSARHRDAHYRDIAREIATLVPGPQARVLDFGCGEALHADLVAAAAAGLVLCDAAPNVRRAIAARAAGNSKIRVMAPEEVERLPEGSFDLIVANSVLQYLAAAEFDALLATWRRLLAPGGQLIVADVIPPQVGMTNDLVALLRYAWTNGFLPAALVGVVRTALSPYRRLRATVSIARYSEAELVAKLAAAGFSARRMARNLEHNQARMTFACTPAPAGRSPAG